MSTLEKNTQHLAKALASLKDGYLVVVTGAGISVASGLPTFRGTEPDAVWSRDVTEMGTYRFFREDPVTSWRWYLSRFSKLLNAEPNPAHDAVAALERWQLERGGRFLLVTQNIDTLHEAAGSQEMVKVHGTADRVRCPTDGCVHGAPAGSLPRNDFDITAFQENPSLEHLPRCPACGDILRQHVLWFDEFYAMHADYQWEKTQEAAMEADLLLFIGTSFAVGVTELFLQAGTVSRTPMISIDPGKAMAPMYPLDVLGEKAEELLPAACAELGVKQLP